ncbi:hypothetical protein [Nannocystis radixulma]|uniref:Uncharacterized protein n=1 Tax=Nannocystis radixulma TaxID=2995305 RepID=A0ABT5B7S0_9BACT|nr:hypothetical protein [Nannocystis radixulma]MDC0669142.1 hypothetical protein [Nannocystis radixulma]
MTAELEKTAMAALVEQGLPLGYARIFTSDTIIADETKTRVTLELTKFRHSVIHVGRAGKPISKPEL